MKLKSRYEDKGRASQAGHGHPMMHPEPPLHYCRTRAGYARHRSAALHARVDRCADARIIFECTTYSARRFEHRIPIQIKVKFSQIEA